MSLEIIQEIDSVLEGNSLDDKRKTVEKYSTGPCQEYDQSVLNDRLQGIRTSVLSTRTINTTIGGELTREDLENMEPNTMFAHGTIVNAPEGIYMTNSNIGRLLKWVAVRRGIPEFSVYVLWDDEHDFDYVKSNGDTVSDMNNVKKLVPCTAQALKMYAH